MRDEWFRSPAWDDEARADFDAHLNRARRSGRPQYRRIKATVLLATHDPSKEAAARGLLEHVIADPDAYGFEKVTALCQLGTHYQDSGRLDEAERCLRDAMDRMAAGDSGGSELEPVRLAETLLERGSPDQLREANKLLDGLVQSPPLILSSRFRMCVAGVRVSLAMGDRERAAQWARSGLEAAEATHSGLAKHPKLGLVETDLATKSWLMGVADGRTKGPAHR